MRVLPTLLVLAFLAASACCKPFDASFITHWMAQGGKNTEISGHESVPDFRHKLLRRLGDWASDFLGTTTPESVSEYPYFNFLPQFMAATIPDGDSVSWSADCFQDTSASAVSNDDGSITITLVAENPTSLTCSDHYALLTVTGWDLVSVFLRGDHTITWTLPDDANDAETWDLQTKGIRFMRFMTSSPEQTVANLIQTVKLFEPEFTQGVSDSAAALNVEFLAEYPQFIMTERDQSDNIVPDESEVNSGDFFGVIRLDGLDPMLGWGMGSATGHTTMALWIDGELYITESTVSDSYWPTNGVQKTPYLTWVQQAEDAGFNTVHVPLSEEMAAQFNETAAVEFFNTVEGLDYGYYTLLWGWIDTVKDNYPCIPPDYSSTCLQWEFVESVFALIDRVIPQLSDKIWNQAWNHRLNTSGLSTAELYYQADQLGLEAREIPTIVEQDSWLYNTTRDGEPAIGKSMVCCVYVCNGWKAGGIFNDIDDEVNCGELTNWDDYALTIFEGTYQQFTGAYTLTLNDFMTKVPYAHMAESCPGLAPDYERPDNC